MCSLGRWVPCPPTQICSYFFYLETEHWRWERSEKGRTSRQVICQSVNNMCLVPTKWQLNWPSSNIHGRSNLFSLPSHSGFFNLSNECLRGCWRHKSNCRLLYFITEFLHPVNPLLILLLFALLSSLTTLVLASCHCSLLISALFGSPALIHSPC